MGSSFRLLKILRVLFSERIDELLPQPKRRFLKALAWCTPLVRGKRSRGERLRDALQTLGPVFVKFGQMLSTRRDLLPQDIAGPLAELQDRVKPFSEKVSRSIIETDLDCSIDEIFSEFSSEVMASASVAQVHAAQLKTGEKVIVKVIRPGIEKVIEEDLKLMTTIAKFVEKNFIDGKRLKLVQVVSDYRMTILDELDLMREAANTALIRRNFINSPICYVPNIYWDYTRRNVMVEERVYGTPISRIDVFKAKKVNMERLAERGVEIFFTQVFDHSFFHADMHPGNVFVDIADPENPIYKAVDFGIVGTLDPTSQAYLAQNLIAFFDRDYRAVAELHVESGWVPKDTNIGEFESAIRTVCEPIFQKPLGEISFGILLIRLFEVARRFQMEVQPQLILLQKTLLNIEGLGRELYPELDLWKTGKPFLDRWVKERLGARGIVEYAKRNISRWAVQFPALTNTVLSTPERLERLESIQIQQAESLSQVAREGKKRRLSGHVSALLGIFGLILSGSALIAEYDWLAMYWPLTIAVLSLVLLVRR
ncbi:MAG: ubiquinone biosynthesis regulatory protein kinase UbiB [Gammaproteobacteria bacterium]|nr:ubiquinone biosynthesis regulatory protein kinase UbiB [Gammaproteobacteria bacterium]